MLDQRFLPMQEVYRTYTNYLDVAEAITEMVIRGAPAIGIAAGMGIVLGARATEAKTADEFKERMNGIFEAFARTRPTAVNLFHVITRMKKIVQEAREIDDARKLLEQEAVRILDEDVKTNRQIGKNGSRYISDGDVVMTYCNTGSLATGGYGTALGIIRTAVEEGKKIEVYACETRPYLQGARITAWELHRENIKVTLITDNMAGHFMRGGVIKKVVVGADRIAANGDTANKIGTYMQSVLARENGIPFYVAAPTTTLDPDTPNGDAITIEERHIDEVAFIGGVQIAPEGVFIRNPAFDITPVKNITAIITERGVVENPKEKGIKSLLEPQA